MEASGPQSVNIDELARHLDIHNKLKCVLQECGRNDEAVMGRCSTGGGHTGNGDCPDGNVHGIYCCEIDFLSSNQTQDQDQDQDQVP